MERTAYQWGLAHRSCPEALEQRAACPGTQRDWWRECPRGDWLIWQLEHGLAPDELAAVQPALLRAVDYIVKRAVRQHAPHCVAVEVELWARRWLGGECRSEVAATAAVIAAADAAAARTAVRAEAEAAELRRQARDIRREIPQWEWKA